LTGLAAPLAATIEQGDLVNATGTVSLDGRRVIVDDPAAVTRFGASSPSGGPAETQAVAYSGPQSHQFAAGQPTQIGPLVAILAVLGLVFVLVVGAIAWRLGWANRLRNWPNRLRNWPNRVRRRGQRI
jgi:hypothetical protein